METAPAMKRRPGNANDDNSIHEEMLRHLRDHPPAPDEEMRTGDSAQQRRRSRLKSRRRPGSERTATRPSLMLRRLRADLALERLVRFLTLHHRRGTPEVLVIVGKGRSSPQGEAVLGPAVRQLCQRRSDLVRRIQTAPPEEGGEGALIVGLQRPR